MSKRLVQLLAVLPLGAAFAACSGSDSAAPLTAAPTTTITESTAPTTEATTTEPTTTVPAALDLSGLPGLLAVEGKSCAPEEYPEHNIIESSVICTLRPDGSGVEVVSQPGEQPGGPIFSRDGIHLLYGDQSTGTGFVVDLTTGEHRERVRGEPRRSGVSPDGQWILFNDHEMGGISISHIDLSPFPDGSLSKLVAADPNYYAESSPSWAPDSIHFAYLALPDGADASEEGAECPELWIGSIDGTPPAQITMFEAEPDGAVGCPETLRWSPSDDRILLRMLGKPAYTAENLYTIRSDGSDLTALTRGEPIFDMNASGYAAENSSYAGDWSPDGKYIAFIMGDGITYHLYVMNSDGSQVTLVESTPLGITTSLISLRWALG